MQRRMTVITACLAVLAPLALTAGCSEDEPEEPKRLTAEDIGGDARRVEGDPDLTPEPVCGVDREFVEQALAEDALEVWERTVDGHRERVVVGLWKIEQGDAIDGLKRVSRRKGACDSEDYWLEGSPAGDASLSLGFLHTQRAAPHRQTRRAYLWMDDYLMTAWVERAESTADTREQDSAAELVDLQQDRVIDLR